MKDSILSSVEEGLSAAPHRTEIIFHEWTDEVWARGAACLVLRKLYEAPLASQPPAAAEEEKAALGR